jgi:transcriptional regulator with XRE-family HTH domain
MTTTEKLGRFLREKRKGQGYSQRALAIQAGIPQRTISEYERGVRDPRFLQAIELALLLDVSLDEMSEAAGMVPAWG